MLFKAIGIIPARYHSTRFPGKPLSLIAGKTLLQRTYERACLSSLDELIVATDDERIVKHVQEFGGRVVLTSLECLTGTDRLAETLIQHPEWLQAKAIVNIQGDEPCVAPESINQLVDLLCDPSAHMSTLVTPLDNATEAMQTSIVKCVMDRQHYALFFSRALIPSNKSGYFNSQSPYFRHLGLYAYRPDFLLTYQKLSPTPLQLAEDLEQLKALEHGYRIKVGIVKEAGLGVDYPEDIFKVEQWLCKQNTFS